MTAPAELIDPREQFLARPDQLADPGQQFLDSGQFAPPVTPEAHRRHIERDLAVAVVVAALAVRRHLADQEPTVTDTRAQAQQAWRKVAPTWLQVAVPAIREAYALGRVEGLTSDELSVLAADYAGELGEYVNQTSAESLAAGMDAQLADRWNEKLAWHRAVQAYGLNKRDMLAYITAATRPVGDRPPEGLIPPVARALADKALTLRAERIGKQEAYSAEQSGQAVAWIWLQKTGRLGPGYQRGWLLGDTETHCATCLELHQQEVPLSDPFMLVSGAKIWAPRAHPGCDCRVKLVPPAEEISKGTEVAGLCVRAADTGRVLMLQRALDPKDPAGGMWEFPGGHLEHGEIPLQGAKREWEEEVGRRLPREARAMGMWKANGIYTGFVVDVPSESLVPPHRRGSVVNPDGDDVEAYAWWDVEQLSRNPSVRPELRASLPKVRRALGADVVKAYDPHEVRDGRGRWADVAERPPAEQILPPVAPPPNPLARPANPLARATNPLARTGNPLARPANPLARTGNPLTRPGNPLARRKRPSRTERRIIVVPPGQHPPSRDDYYMDADDYFTAVDWKIDKLGIGDPVEFDPAQAAVGVDLTAFRRSTAWRVVKDDTEDDDSPMMRRQWLLTLDTARAARQEAMDDVAPLVLGGQGRVSLTDEDVAYIAAAAGYEPTELPSNIRARIVRSVRVSQGLVHTPEPDDGSLGAAYGDYVTFVRPTLLGENGVEVDRMLDSTFGPDPDMLEKFEAPRQAMVIRKFHPGTLVDHHSLRPQEDYFVQGLRYASVLGEDIHDTYPGVLGMQELYLEPLKSES